MKVCFFMWLACRDRLWTAARRHRRGLQDSTACALCDQELEDSDHLFARCSYTQQLWHLIRSILHSIVPGPVPGGSLTEWWLQMRHGLNATQKKGIDSSIMLISWMIWRERNNRVFGRATPLQPAQLLQQLIDETVLWSAAGAKHLVTIGWPAATEAQATGERLHR